MARTRSKIDEILSTEAYCANPAPPQPLVVVVAHRVDAERLLFLRNVDPELIVREIKSQLARQIAQYIVDKTQLLKIDMPAILGGWEAEVRLEFTLNDRGAYTNWIPKAENRGFKQRVAAVKKALPYGFEEIVEV